VDLASYLQKGPSFINLDVFNQILDMDDDEEGDDEEAFSEGIVGGFFDQAETTFASMEKALYVSLPFFNQCPADEVGKKRTWKNSHP
jgi:hypothetical protein